MFLFFASFFLLAASAAESDPCDKLPLLAPKFPSLSPYKPEGAMGLDSWLEAYYSITSRLPETRPKVAVEDRAAFNEMHQALQASFSQLHTQSPLKFLEANLSIALNSADRLPDASSSAWHFIAYADKALAEKISRETRAAINDEVLGDLENSLGEIAFSDSAQDAAQAPRRLWAGKNPWQSKWRAAAVLGLKQDKKFLQSFENMGENFAIQFEANEDRFRNYAMNLVDMLGSYTLLPSKPYLEAFFEGMRKAELALSREEVLAKSVSRLETLLAMAGKVANLPEFFEPGFAHRGGAEFLVAELRVLGAQVRRDARNSPSPDYLNKLQEFLGRVEKAADYVEGLLEQSAPPTT
jgi:hypothetical protein